MGTKTVDENGAEAAEAAEVEAAEAAEKVEKAEAEAEPEDAAEVEAEAASGSEAESESESEDASDVKASSGVGQGAAAVVSAALGVIGLSGGWVGTVAAARSNIVGQLETSQSASVANQIQALYGDSWKITALVAGAFALAALLVGFLVLVRPAFGAPAKEQAPWIKSVAWAGVALGVIGLLLAIAKYSDLLLGLPSAS